MDCGPGRGGRARVRRPFTAADGTRTASAGHPGPYGGRAAGVAGGRAVCRAVGPYGTTGAGGCQARTGQRA